MENLFNNQKSVDYRFLYSHDLNVPFMGDIEKEKLDASHSQELKG